MNISSNIGGIVNNVFIQNGLTRCQLNNELYSDYSIANSEAMFTDMMAAGPTK